MKKKSRRPAIRRRNRVSKMSPPGAIPGYLNFETGKKPELLLHRYSIHQLQEQSLYHVTEAGELAQKHPDEHFWLQIIGYGNSSFFRELQQAFPIHPLELEDVISGNSRPKMEYGNNHIFDISRMLFYNSEGNLLDEQISVFVFDNLIITLQENQFDCLNPVKERLRRDGTLLRTSPVFYLYYAICDAVIDNYFPLIEHIESELERIEEALFDNPQRYLLTEIQNLRRDLLYLRKTVGAERENLSELMRGLDKERADRFGIYLQDAYEHSVQIIDLIESQKEIAFSLIDIYLSTINNRLSEVMKVLTVISSIFIPMSFVAGFYGMNFQPESKTGESLPWNMPELYQPYGYLGVIGLLVLIVIVQIIFFRRKGWI